MKKISNMVLLSEDEYNELTNPDKAYTLMTKTAASKAVKNMLKHFKYTCWIDSNDSDMCCGQCPVMKVLGEDAGTRICTRQKNWSK